MSEIKPMVVYPFDAEKEDQIHSSTPSPPTKIGSDNVQTGSGVDSVVRIIRMVLQLAQIKAFNENFNIRGDNGEYIPNTNLAKLLSLTQHRVRSQKGVPEMIKLLYEAKIDPNLILNEVIKAKLIEMNNGKNDGTNNIRPESPGIPEIKPQSPGIPEIQPQSPGIPEIQHEMPKLDGPFPKVPIKRPHDRSETEVPIRKFAKVDTIEREVPRKIGNRKIAKRLRKIDQDQD